MKNVFKPGDRKEVSVVVTKGDFVSFKGSVVNQVYATFALARDAEWITRQFVSAMCEEGEEGIAIFLGIDHKNQAHEGEEVIITAWVDQLHGSELFCFFEAKVDDRLIAVGKTGQRIVKQERVDLMIKQA